MRLRYKEQALPLLSAEINRLIHSIYQGVLEDAPWSNFTSQLQQLFQAECAVLTIHTDQQQGDKRLVQRICDSNSKINELQQPLHWIALDPFQSIDNEQATLLDELSHGAITDTDIYQDLIKPAGIRYILALNINVNGSPDMTVKIRLARIAEQYQFSESDRQLLTSLIEHIKLALHFLDQMAIQKIERNAFADAINQFMLGTLILDQEGKVVASNRVARDTIEQYSQLAIINKAFVIRDKKVNQQLYEALDTIEKGGSDQSPLPRTLTVGLSESLALGLMIRPVRPEDTIAYPAHAHSVVFLSDPKWTADISSATLRELFGFTEGESKVAAYLANGYTLNEAAEKLSISVNTAKSHARCIYEKTGVNKQTKLIQLISNSVARVC